MARRRMSVRLPANQTFEILSRRAFPSGSPSQSRTPPFDHLKINMPSANICMIENHISPQIATDYCKRLI